MSDLPIWRQLTDACRGLSFTSETESPVEPARWPASGELSADGVRAAAGIAADAPVEEMTVADFFRAVPKADRPRFDALVEALAGLRGVKVYKFGRVRMAVVILGVAADGDWLGVRTEVVET
jgi:hypothetical protein